MGYLVLYTKLRKIQDIFIEYQSTNPPSPEILYATITNKSLIKKQYTKQILDTQNISTSSCLNLSKNIYNETRLEINKKFSRTVAAIVRTNGMRCSLVLQQFFVRKCFRLVI